MSGHVRSDSRSGRFYIDLRPHARIYRIDGRPFLTHQAAAGVLESIREKAERLGSVASAIAMVVGDHPVLRPVEAGEQLPWQETYRRRMFIGAKQRSADLGLPFNLEIRDIVIPRYCPVLGGELVPTERGTGRGDFAPSLDRIDPAAGYIRGNVVVISWRANRIKNSFDAEELRKVSEWLEYLRAVPLLEDAS